MQIDLHDARRRREIEAYETDASWLSEVMEYAGLDAEACADLIACFFRDRAGRDVPMDLPLWAVEADAETYESKRNAVCKARGWSPDLSLAGILHLEAIARESYKRARVSVDCRSIEGRYDAIVLADVLEHTLDPLEVLAHLLPRLAPSGLLFVNYPHEIEGDWHTPEAYHLYPWCLRLLRAWGSRLAPHSWRPRPRPWPTLALRVLDVVHPQLLARARRFARRTFRERGDELAAVVRERAHRDVTAEQLLASVEG